MTAPPPAAQREGHAVGPAHRARVSTALTAAAGLVCAAVVAVGGEGVGGGRDAQQLARTPAPAWAAAAAPSAAVRYVLPAALARAPAPGPFQATAAPPPPEPEPGPTGPAARTGAGTPAPPPGAGVPAPGAHYAWPLLPPPALLGPFEAPPHVYGRGHRGVDLAGAPGQPVLAARAGTVVFAGPVGGRGVVSVQHDDGLRTTYEPVRPAVVAGASVRAGDVVGFLEPGHAGCAPATCLHWGVRRDRTEYLDPLVLLRPPRVRLLPVPDPWPLRTPAR
jgi:murein DD-endopeptidase MepM/ murein hydrolase activator NlpD